MKPEVSVGIRERTVENALSGRYDHALACVGYESRSRSFFEQFNGEIHDKLAICFQEQHVLAFRRNRDFFTEFGFGELAPHAEAIAHWASGLRVPDSRAVSLLIDISSMNRFVIAAICLELRNASLRFNSKIEVDFVYSHAAFGDIPNSFGPIVYNGPVVSALGGWPKNSGAPPGLILGIGYEQDLALGILEELEPAQTWAFRPKDHEARYDDAIDEKNRGLFEEIPRSHLVRYSVFDPISLFFSVEGLIALTKKDYRLIVVPFGPKIFALSACLAAMRHYPEIGLWRVSGGANMQPVDRLPSGKTLVLQAVFEPKMQPSLADTLERASLPA